MSIVGEVYAGTGVSGSVDGDRLTTARFQQLEGLAWNLDGSRLYTIDNGAYRIRYVDTATNLVHTLVSSGLDRPEACEIAPDGSLWVGDQGNARIIQVDVATAAITPRRTGVAFANVPRISLDGLWVYYIALTTQVRRFPYPSGAESTIATGFTQAEEMRFHPGNGLLYVCDFGAGIVYAVDPITGTKTAVVTGVGNSNGIAIGADGQVYISTRTFGTIVKYDPVSNTFATYFSDLNVPNSIDFGPDGLLYVNDFADHQIIRLVPGVAWITGSVLAGPPPDAGWV